MDLAQLIIESNKSLPTEEVGRYVDRINELLSVLSNVDEGNEDSQLNTRKSTFKSPILVKDANGKNFNLK